MWALAQHREHGGDPGPYGRVAYPGTGLYGQRQGGTLVVREVRGDQAGGLRAVAVAAAEVVGRGRAPGEPEDEQSGRDDQPPERDEAAVVVAEGGQAAERCRRHASDGSGGAAGFRPPGAGTVPPRLPPVGTPGGVGASGGAAPPGRSRTRGPPAAPGPAR